jgi:hypothetical protein
MNNDPVLSGKDLGSITSDFVKVADLLKEGSYQIRKHGFSKYPIFPISKEQIPIGNLLYRAGELENVWNYHVTYLDEFIQRKIVDEEKLDLFYESYKDPDEFCCLFVVDKAFTRFVYIPYPEDNY